MTDDHYTHTVKYSMTLDAGDLRTDITGTEHGMVYVLGGRYTFSLEERATNPDARGAGISHIDGAGLIFRLDRPICHTHIADGFSRTPSGTIPGYCFFPLVSQFGIQRVSPTEWTYNESGILAARDDGKGVDGKTMIGANYGRFGAARAIVSGTADSRTLFREADVAGLRADLLKGPDNWALVSQIASTEAASANCTIGSYFIIATASSLGC